MGQPAAAAAPVTARSIAVAVLLTASMVANVAADDGAAPLFIVHFETGPAWDKARPPAEQPGFAEHSTNMNRLRQEGAIAFGARYGDYGLIFLEAASLDAARALLEADPGVRAGIFVFRVAPLSVFYPWQN